MIVNAKPSGILSLGRTGENQARSIRFDISHWVMDFGPGVVQLVHQRSGDPYPYPVVVSQDGNEVTWNITSTDTAAAGSGRAELQYFVGETLAKSETWMTKVFPALGPAAETPPDPYQSWVDRVLQAGATAAEAADRAEEAAVRQPYPNAETGTWWVWDAESGAYTDTGVSYGTGGGGTSDHDKLLGRNKADQHPISAITGLEDALAGKQPTGSYLTKETDPTVPAWAKAETKPAYTAHEVGADSSGTAASLVTAHNTGADTHNDIRLLIQGLTDRLNALADSDDTTLDQLSEIVAYIKLNRDLIAAVTTDKVSVGDIVNDLVTNVANKPLSAAQGVALKALIDAINAVSIGAIPAPATAAVGQTIRVSAVDENGQPTEWEAVDFAIGGGEWELINEATLTVDEISEITISEDSNGNPFELSAVYVLIFGKGSVDSGIKIEIQSTTNEAYKNVFHGFGLLSNCLSTDGKWSAAYIEHICNTEWNTAFKGNSFAAAGPAATQNYDAYISMNYSTWQAKPDGNIRVVQLTPFSGTFSSGAKLILYGKRV